MKIFTNSFGGTYYKSKACCLVGYWPRILCIGNWGKNSGLMQIPLKWAIRHTLCIYDLPCIIILLIWK